MKSIDCFIGGSRYSYPLDPTSGKKFKALSSLGEIHVIAFSNSSRPRKFTEHARFYLLPLLPIPTLRHMLMLIVGTCMTLWCILRNNVRVVVAQGPYEGYAAAWAKIIARIAGKKVSLIIESHGDFEVTPLLQRKIKLPKVYLFLLRKVFTFSIRSADVLRAVSDATKSQLEALAPEKPVMKFPAWTDIEAFLEAGEHKNTNGEEKSILYSGALIPGRGIHFLLDAFADIVKEEASLELLIIGKEENRQYSGDLKEAVRRKGLEESVRFLNHMLQSELAREMARAKVVVLPSLSEGLGRVLFEAMACGTPVIGSNVGGIPEIITDGENGFLVPPADKAALTERLRWIAHHPTEAYRIGQRGRDFARAFFSVEAYVNNYDKLLKLAMRQ